MIFSTQISASLAYVLFLCFSTSFTIAQSYYTTVSIRPSVSAASSASAESSSQTLATSIELQPLPQSSDSNESDRASVSSSTNPVHNALNYSTIVWDISETLSLTINIGDWRLSQEKVLETLSAADAAVGKKPASLFMDSKFTQKTGSRINAMLFEIGPGYEDRRLTWGEVGEIVGEHGLPAYFRQDRIWRSIRFEVFDVVRGKLGVGAVRKWYQPHLGGNATVAASDDLAVS